MSGLLIESQHEPDVHLRLKAFVFQRLESVKSCHYRALVIRCASAVNKAVALVCHFERVCCPAAVDRHHIEMAYYSEILIAAVFRLPLYMSGVIVIVVCIKAEGLSSFEHVDERLMHARSEWQQLPVLCFYGIRFYTRFRNRLCKSLQHIVFISVYPFKISHVFLLISYRLPQSRHSRDLPVPWPRLQSL